MTIIDRYILRIFAMNFVILMTVLLALFVSVDLVVNLDSFLRAAQTLADNHHTWVGREFAWVLMDYYGPICLMLYVYLSGIVVVAAMGFAVTSLQRTRELTAIVASGISLRRVALAIAAASLALNLLAAPVQQWILPPLANKALRSHSEMKKGRDLSDAVLLMPVNRRGDLLSAVNFDANRGTLTRFRLMERDETGARLRTLAADLARWDEASGVWRFEPAAQAVSHPGGFGAPPEVKPMPEWRTDLSPKVIRSRQKGNFSRLLSLGDIGEMADNPVLPDDMRDSLKRTWWSRLAMPILNMLFTLVALPFFLSRIPVISPKQVIRATAVCLGCWMGGVLMMSAAVLPPFLAVWTPVALTAGLAGWMMARVKT